MKKTLLIAINPKSGKVKHLKVEESIFKYLDKSKFKYEIFYTQHARQLIEISHEKAELYDALVVVGGDGSVNEIIQGLVHSHTPLGIIPLGSGNGFARHLGIPVSVKKSIEVLNQFRAKRIDSIKINNHFMVNVGGLGFDAHISNLFQYSETRGFNTYIKLVAKEFFRYKTSDYIIQTSKGVSHEQAFLISISNSGQFGNNAYISPKSDIDDGLFELNILKKFPLPSAPILATRLFTRSMHQSRWMKTIHEKKATITLPKHYSLHLDGDFMDLGKVLDIEIQPKSLSVIVP